MERHYLLLEKPPPSYLANRLKRRRERGNLLRVTTFSRVKSVDKNGGRVKSLYRDGFPKYVGAALAKIIKNNR